MNARCFARSKWRQFHWISIALLHRTVSQPASQSASQSFRHSHWMWMGKASQWLWEAFQCHIHYDDRLSSLAFWCFCADYNHKCDNFELIVKYENKNHFEPSPYVWVLVFFIRVYWLACLKWCSTLVTTNFRFWTENTTLMLIRFHRNVKDKNNGLTICNMILFFSDVNVLLSPKFSRFK